MESKPAIEFTNTTTKPLMLVVEPLGEDYTMLPNDEVAFVLSTEEPSLLEHGLPSINLREDGITVFYNFRDYEVHFNGVRVECGHQRPLDLWRGIEFEIMLSATPKEIYELWIDAERLGIVFGSPVEEISKKPHWTGKFFAYNKHIEWVNVLKEPYSNIYQIWRSSDFPGTAPDSHIEIKFEEAEDGSRLLISLHMLPENLQGNCKEYWNKYFFEPMERYFQNQKSVK